MNEEIIKVHQALQPHIFQLQGRWAQFRFLFTVSDKRMTVLFNVAPGFFGVVRDVFRDDVFISLSRLTDKHNTYGNSNLTLATLVELAKSSGNKELADSSKSLFEQLLEEVGNIRTWRNKWLAHTDYCQSLLAQPLAEFRVQRGQIDRSISLIIDLMNLFSKHLELPYMLKELPIIAGDADVLARILESYCDSES